MRDVVSERLRCKKLQTTNTLASTCLMEAVKGQCTSVIGMAGSVGAALWSRSEGLVWGLKGAGQGTDAGKSSSAERLSRCSFGPH